MPPTKKAAPANKKAAAPMKAAAVKKGATVAKKPVPILKKAAAPAKNAVSPQVVERRENALVARRPQNLRQSRVTTRPGASHGASHPGKGPSLACRVTGL